MSWIHIDDWIEMMLWAIEKSSVSGPINLAAPEPVSNAEFSRALGRAMHRPSWMPVPGFALRVIVGEMANDALLLGHRILPRRAQELGYVFRHPGIDEALAAAVRGQSDRRFDS
jgi:NAD dependent epimerase/dehydratase family enzyme